MKERKFTFHVQGGVSLILLVFMVLSLISFAALSIVSAVADLRQSARYEARTTGYYAAYSEAQKYLAKLDAELAASDPDTTAASDDSFPVAASKAFPAGEGQQLVIEYRILDKARDGRRYELLCERLESTTDYELDTSLPVFGN